MQTRFNRLTKILWFQHTKIYSNPQLELLDFYYVGVVESGNAAFKVETSLIDGLKLGLWNPLKGPILLACIWIYHPWRT